MLIYNRTVKASERDRRNGRVAGRNGVSRVLLDILTSKKIHYFVSCSFSVYMRIKDRASKFFQRSDFKFRVLTVFL